MPASPALTFLVPEPVAGCTLAAFLRSHLPGQSWREVRRLIETRRVRIGGELCLDPARRLRPGERVEVAARPAPVPRPQERIRIRYVDSEIVVVEKPPGLSTVRHPLERDLSARRRALSPTLQDLLPLLINRAEGRLPRAPLTRLRVVHRLDKETSGLVVFARTAGSERELGRQFHRHTVARRYLAVVRGILSSQRITSRLVRDRGDGRRGSTTVPGVGKLAITEVEEVERLRGHTLLSCRLETGRTHQIRIHLAERGHPVCGDRVYGKHPGAADEVHACGAPRLALHATELGLAHPVSGQAMHWTMPPPDDLRAFIERLRRPARERPT